MTQNALSIVKHEIQSPAMQDQFKLALPKSLNITTEQFMRAACTMLTPDIAKCDRGSVMQGLLSAAALGLMPENFLGQVYLVPYKGKAQLQVGYKGMIALARRSGDIKSIDSGVIYEKDKFTYKKGLETVFEIEPYYEGDPGKAILVYCIIQLGSASGGGYQIEVMPVDAVEKIREASPSKNSPAWKSHWDQMARKTCIKRALNYAPLSADVQKAVAIDSGAQPTFNPQDREIDITPDEEEVAPKEPAKKKPARKTNSEKIKEAAAPRGPLGDNDDGDPGAIPPGEEDQGPATVDGNTGAVV